MSGAEGFLKRWSRLKTKEREEVRRASSDVASNSQETTITISKEKKIDEKRVSELPPVESLTKDSDFTAFLRKGVPEALRQQALRKLWASDPTIATPDPFDFQNVDFTKLVTGEAVATSYEVGGGFADRIEAAAERTEDRRSSPAAEPSGSPADGATQGDDADGAKKKKAAGEDGPPRQS
ncbi:MAG: DUF3306 domain-containing protein [Alphaproteobacteria bacterium]|nr:DUF3306 domain-containing protein [Alphaproteobacteria bacterium]